MVKVKNIVDYKEDIPNTFKSAYLPEKVFIPVPLTSSDGLKVKIGSQIKEGQLLYSDKEEHGNIHTSVPGIVAAFDQISLFDGTTSNAVEIHLSGSFSHLGKLKKKKKIDSFEPDKIIYDLDTKGVINTFKDPQLLSEQIKITKEKKESPILIVRLYDLDPTCYTDTFMCKQFLHKVLDGAILLSTALKSPCVVFLYDPVTFICKNPDTEIQNVLFEFPSHFIPINTSFYPCGGGKEIVDLIRKTNIKELASVSLDDLMVDSTTLYTLYESLVYNEPVMEQFVFVSGDCINEPKILKIRIGSPIHKLIAECKISNKKVGRIIANGLIRGNEVLDLNSPVTKNLKSIYVMAKENLQDRESYACIRCGKCRLNCPAKLHPDMIYAGVDGYRKEAAHCYDCSVCNAICPSRLKLNQAIINIKNEDIKNG